MTTYTGSCYCRNVQYELTLNSPDEARTSICHCKNCKVSFLRAQYSLTNAVWRPTFPHHDPITIDRNSQAAKAESRAKSLVKDLSILKANIKSRSTSGIMDLGRCSRGSFVRIVGVGSWSLVYEPFHEDSRDVVDTDRMLYYVQENAGDHTYIFYGTLDEPDALPPKGEFFMKYKAKYVSTVEHLSCHYHTHMLLYCDHRWMPEVPGEYTLAHHNITHDSILTPSNFPTIDVFHKNEIKE